MVRLRRDKLFDFMVDFDGKNGDPRISPLLRDLRSQAIVADFGHAITVPWFPTRIDDIDAFSGKTLDAGAELDSDHPGFADKEYRSRREMIVSAALKYRHGDPLPHVEYTEDETKTWGIVYDKVKEYSAKYAISTFNEILPLMEQHCGYARDNIPQLADISDFLQSRTGFTMRPIGGLLSARDFLNALAFRVFFSTQYIRHVSRPLYTPEPDICHELMGHAPMFADPDFADFSHEIGLASLGATDEEIKKLATCYWFSVEFGLCLEEGKRKAYGAGLLSSFGELEYACSTSRPGGGVDTFPEYLPWDPATAATRAYPITTYQPAYFVAESLQDAKIKMREYCEGLTRPFGVRYNAYNASVSVDRALVRGAYTVTLQT
jgi:phenylalanine-4-hydroxylase